MKRIILVLAAAIALISTDAFAQSPKGHLVIIGGGTRTPQIMNRYFDLAGGRNAKFLVITTAGHKTPQIDGEEAIVEYEGYGVKNVKWIAPTREQANDPKYIKKHLNGVTGVFFTGGLQKRIIDTLRGSEMHKAIMEMYEKDGIVVAGTSAGAGMMTDPMIAGSRKPVKSSQSKDNKVTDIKKGNARITPGMGFLKNAIIDQHFIKRARENRFFSAAFDHPEVTAFGIDEATAMVVSNGNEVEIIGEGSVMVAEVDASTIKKDKNGNYGCSGLTLRILLDGDTYTIKEK